MKRILHVSIAAGNHKNVSLSSIVQHLSDPNIPRRTDETHAIQKSETKKQKNKTEQAEQSAVFVSVETSIMCCVCCVLYMCCVLLYAK